jgi:hypothetical protein
MSNQSYRNQINRRDFLKLVGGAGLIVAGASVMPQFLRKTLLPEEVVGAAGDYDLFFAGTDGWFFMPPEPPISPWHPDTLAPAPFTTYIFGFRNVDGLTDEQRINQKEKAQHNAPFFWVDQFDPDNPVDFKVQLTNLGLALRPDLTDAHTLHWHGFRNVIPFFDGEPTGSVSVPVGQFFTYVYRPRDPGTYMYHCHVEDIEHVTMGMTSLVFVRPIQNNLGDGTLLGSWTHHTGYRYAYNDGDGSTYYDRENALFLNEIWAQGHWGDAHIQDRGGTTSRRISACSTGGSIPIHCFPTRQLTWQPPHIH